MYERKEGKGRETRGGRKREGEGKQTIKAGLEAKMSVSFSSLKCMRGRRGREGKGREGKQVEGGRGRGKGKGKQTIKAGLEAKMSVSSPS
jgi:hypothetical protein